MLVHRYKIAVFTKQKYRVVHVKTSKRSRFSKYYVMEIKYHNLQTQWRLKILVSQFWKRTYKIRCHNIWKSDPAVFIWHNQSKVNRLLCTHIDDFLFGGTKLFLNKVINPIKRVLTIGSEHCAALKYLGLIISQSNSEIIIDQVNYITSVDFFTKSNDRKDQ